MNLNIGCGGAKSRGQYKTKEWMNIDLVSGDVRASALALPFRDGTFARIHAIHVLEHIPRPFHNAFHQEMYRVLEPGGLYFVEVPNIHEVCNELLGLVEAEDVRDETIKERIRCLTLSLYGKHRHVGDDHHWGFFPHVLCDDLRNSGFVDREWLHDKEDMISSHYKQESIILFRASK